ncbi:MAG: hypothetical protein ACTSVV_13815 [Promethearchaeota archaeon]
MEKPNKLNENEIFEALGKLLWGKNGGKFTMKRLTISLMKKRLRGKK